MSRWLGCCFVLLTFVLSAPAQPVPQAIEKRYNGLHSLKAQFQETVSYAGRTRREESGRLYLLRPRKMRWEYSDPAGKLFVSDGKMFYLYNPNSNLVQKISPREAEDLRAPLAFLLGHLDFQKEFGKLTVEDGPDAIVLKAAARNAQEPFTEAVFTVAPGTYEIQRIVVTGQDGLTTEFKFSGEMLNPPLESRLFEFHAPPGAEIMEPGR